MKTRIKTLGIWGLLLVCSLFVIGLLGIAAQNPEAAAMTFTGISALPLAFAGTRLFGEKIFDWKEILNIPEADRKDAVIDAVNQFIHRISSKEVGRQKFVGPDPNLMGVIPIVLVQSDTIKSPDRGYELLFDEVDLRQSPNDTFELLDVTGGVTFYQMTAGEEAKISKLPSSAKTPVSYLRFTGGYNILDDWLRFNKYYLIDDLTADTVRRWWDKKATIFYGLLAALGGGINESFATDDITTINNACAKILEDLSAAGYAVDENSQFVITANPKLRGRIFKALAATFQTATINNQIVFNVNAVISTTKIANTTYYVSLAGGKNKRGEWDDLNLRLPQRNELVLGAAHVWTGAYNGIIGESKQHRRCALS